MFAVITNLEGGAGIPAWECNQEKFQFLIYFENTLPDPTIRLKELTACVIYMRDVVSVTDRAKSLLQTNNLGTLLIDRQNPNKITIEMPEAAVPRSFVQEGQLKVIMKDRGPNQVNLNLTFPGRTSVEFKPYEGDRMDFTAKIFLDFVAYFSWHIDCAEKGEILPRPPHKITQFEKVKLEEFPPHLIVAERLDKVFDATITTQTSSAPIKKKKDNCIVM